MEREPEDRASWLASVGALAATVVACFAVRWPSRAQHLYELDSANYAFGAREFDVYKHQPHPPGYTLWVLLLRGARRLGFDENAGQIALSIVFLALGLFAFAHLARRVVRSETVAVLCTALFFAPGVALAATTAGTYAVDVCTSSVLALFAARAWEGDRRSALVAAILLPLFGGVRASGAALMVPLVAVAVAKANGRDLRAWARVALGSLLSFGAWFLPAARMHGGVVPFGKYLLWSGSLPFQSSSVFFGAPWSAHRNMLADVAVWLAMNLGALAALAIVARGGASARRPSFHGASFYALWLAPVAGLVLLVHAPKPGYLLLAVPALALLLAERVERATLDRRAAIASAVVLAAVGTALATVRTENARMLRASLVSVQESEAAWATALATLSSRPAHDQLVIFAGASWFGPNERTLPFHRPGLRVWFFDAGMVFAHGPAPIEPTKSAFVPREVRRIVWIARPDQLAAVRGAFPDSEPVANGRLLSVLETQLGDEEIDATFTAPGVAVRIRRAAGKPNVAYEWSAGFGAPEQDGTNQWIWAEGPRAELAFDLPHAAPVVATFAVSVAPAPSQKILVEVNGVVVAEKSGVDQGATIDVPFAGKRGRNTIGLVFETWNGNPTPFAPADPRKLALAFDRVELQIGTRTNVLLPR